MANFSVNWRPGTASVYESIWSLQRKFSYLNRIGQIQTREAIAEIKGGGISGDLDVNNPVLKYLGEPFRLFNSCSLSRFLVPASISGAPRRFVVKNLRYCEACISRGYHSPIHQLPWLALCPIHLLQLHESCSKCGKEIPINRWADGNPTSLLRTGDAEFCECEIWPSMRSFEWPSGIRLSEAKPIGAYLRWLRNLEFTPEQKSAYAAKKAFGDCSELQLIDIWRQVLPPPKTVEGFLTPIQFPVTTIRRIEFPTEERAQAVLELVERYGYWPFVEGVIYQCIRRKEKGVWEYYARRFLKQLARYGHGNCAQVVQPTVKRRFLKRMTIDVEKEIEWICPRCDLFRMIRSPTLAIELDFLSEFVDRNMREDSWVSWFDTELLKDGLAELVHYRDSESRAKLNKSGLRSKVLWGKELSRFATILVIFRQIAAIGFLVSKYSDFFRHRREVRGRWNYSLRSRDVQWPYIVVSIEDRRAIRLAIWSRHKLDDHFEMEDLCDKHPSDIKAVLRKLNRAQINERKRELLERAKRLEEGWQRAIATQKMLSSGD